MTNKTSKPCKGPSCRNVSKHSKHPDMNGDPRLRMVAVAYMVITLFFWYLSFNSLQFYIYGEMGFTRISSIFAAMVSTLGAIVFAYLIYGIIRVHKFNFSHSTKLFVGVLMVYVIVLFMFPLP